MRIPVILPLAAFVALQAAAAHGQSFDGTYRLVAAAPVSATYTSKGGQTAPCPGRNAGPLTIAQGQARYTTETGREVTGTVGPQGELTMRSVSPGDSRPIELATEGRVNIGGTIRARQRGFSCSYDFTWQR
jgi:hypothetical protein